MCDETELNPELESFAANLRNVPAPKANIDRDQLMYDAGWAAAITNNTPKVSVGGRGIASLVMSFAGGVAVAAAVLLSVVPLSQDMDDSAIGHSDIAAIDVKTIEEPEVAPTNFASSDSDEHDLLDWIENLPPGQSINSGFSTRPTNPVLAELDSLDQRSMNQRPITPKTSAQLLSELMPGVATRTSTPTWSAWLTP
jgi:hypothetical protein